MRLALDIEIGGASMCVAEVVSAMQTGLRTEIVARRFKELDISADAPSVARRMAAKGVRSTVFVRVAKDG